MRIILFILILGVSPFAMCQTKDSTSTILVGLRFKKYVGFYWVNGVSGEWHSKKLVNNKLHIGISVSSSKLGSAIHSNALSTWETELSFMYLFRQTKKFNPIIRLNTGIATVQLESSYSSIPSSAFLLSLETGCNYSMGKTHIRLFGGYNVFTGNGITGLGTIYPIYGGIGLMRIIH